jgi:short-subunit dehydrogenase
VDVLINNAGFGTLGTLVRADPGAQAAMIQIHCATPLRLAQAVLPGMIARGDGLVVNVASVAAFVTGPGNATYSGTKAFLRLATDGLSAELAGTGVRVQALCPGFTRTEFHDRMGFAPTNIPRPLWMTPDAVVDASLRAADRGGPVTVIPGLTYRAAVAVLRHLPLRMLSLLIRRAPRNRTRSPR